MKITSNFKLLPRELIIKSFLPLVFGTTAYLFENILTILGSFSNQLYRDYSHEIFSSENPLQENSSQYFGLDFLRNVKEYSFGAYNNYLDFLVSMFIINIIFEGVFRFSKSSVCSFLQFLQHRDDVSLDNPLQDMKERSLLKKFKRMGIYMWKFMICYTLIYCFYHTGISCN